MSDECIERLLTVKANIKAYRLMMTGHHLKHVTHQGVCRFYWHTTKRGAEWICGAVLNGDNLRIFTAYLRISDHCRVRIRVRVRVRARVARSGLELRLGLGLGLGLQIVVYKLLEKATKCGSIT